jgi:hypothetical protein
MSSSLTKEHITAHPGTPFSGISTDLPLSAAVNTFSAKDSLTFGSAN